MNKRNFEKDRMVKGRRRAKVTFRDFTEIVIERSIKEYLNEGVYIYRLLLELVTDPANLFVAKSECFSLNP